MRVATSLLLGSSLLCVLARAADAAQDVPVRASWGPGQLEAEIGEPVEWTLEVAHARRARPTVVSDNLEDQLDRTWAYVSGPRVRTLPAEEDPDVERTTFAWTLMALAPGDRAAPTLVLATDSGEEIEVPAEPLAVRAALGPDEDAARPLAAFHEIPEGSVGRGALLLAFVLLALGAVAVGLAVRRRRARRGEVREAAHGPLEPRAALQALVEQRAAGGGDEPGAVRDLAFEVTSILRRALGGGAPGDTDEEWLDGLGEAALGIRGDLVERAADVVRTCEEIKYAGRIPTRFAIDELLTSARVVLEGLEGAQGTDSDLVATSVGGSA